MVTELTIGNSHSLNQGLEIFDQFEKITGYDLIDHGIMKLSDDSKKVILYTDAPEKDVKILIDILLTNGYPIFSKKDYTYKLLRMFKTDHIGNFRKSFEYEPDFDTKVSSFIAQSTSKTIKKLSIQATFQSIRTNHTKKITTIKPAVNWLYDICEN